MSLKKHYTKKKDYERISLINMYKFCEFTKKILDGKKTLFYCALKTAAALDVSVRKLCKAAET